MIILFCMYLIHFVSGLFSLTKTKTMNTLLLITGLH